MAARIPEELIHKYPALNFGDSQCKYFRNKCQHGSCNYSFKPNEVVCPRCNTPRERCGAKAITATDACRAHTKRGVLSIYNLATTRISEQAIDEVIESDDRSVDAEVAIAKVLLSKILDNEAIPDDRKMKAVKETLEIAAIRKKIETGDDLAIKMDDKTAQAIRRRFKMLIAAFQAALREFIKDDELRIKIMDHVQAASRLAGRQTIHGQNLQKDPNALLPGVRLEI